MVFFFGGGGVLGLKKIYLKVLIIRQKYPFFNNTININVNQCEVGTCNDLKSSMTNNEFQLKILNYLFFAQRAKNIEIKSP